jgi:hypothetical protein
MLSDFVPVKHHAMKTYGSGGIALPFLSSALDGGEWSASRSDSLHPGKLPWCNWVDGLVDPRVGLDAVQ